MKVGIFGFTIYAATCQHAQIGISPGLGNFFIFRIAGQCIIISHSISSYNNYFISGASHLRKIVNYGRFLNRRLKLMQEDCSTAHNKIHSDIHVVVYINLQNGTSWSLSYGS